MSETCSVCNWTNVSLLNIGEPGAPKLICHGCVKRMERELADARDRSIRLEIQLDQRIRLRDELEDLCGIPRGQSVRDNGESGVRILQQMAQERDQWREVAEELIEFVSIDYSDPNLPMEKLRVRKKFNMLKEASK